MASREDCDHGGMQTVFEAADGMDGLRRLAHAWHRRAMASTRKWIAEPLPASIRLWSM